MGFVNIKSVLTRDRSKLLSYDAVNLLLTVIIVVS